MKSKSSPIKNCCWSGRATLQRKEDGQRMKGHRNTYLYKLSNTAIISSLTSCSELTSKTWNRNSSNLGIPNTWSRRCGPFVVVAVGLLEKNGGVVQYTSRLHA